MFNETPKQRVRVASWVVFDESPKQTGAIPKQRTYKDYELIAVRHSHTIHPAHLGAWGFLFLFGAVVGDCVGGGCGRCAGVEFSCTFGARM